MFNVLSMVVFKSLPVILLGNFSSPKVEEFVISRGNILELWRPDDAGNINIICSFEVYGLIRALKPFRLSGICMYWR